MNKTKAKQKHLVSVFMSTTKIIPTCISAFDYFASIKVISSLLVKDKVPLVERRVLLVDCKMVSVSCCFVRIKKNTAIDYDKKKTPRLRGHYNWKISRLYVDHKHTNVNQSEHLLQYRISWSFKKYMYETNKWKYLAIFKVKEFFSIIIIRCSLCLHLKISHDQLQWDRNILLLR